jgi:rhodanese-related sulfurtransferase
MTMTKITGSMNGKVHSIGNGISGRKLSLNIAVKAKDYFAAKNQYIVGPQELYQALQDQPDFINIIDVRQPMEYMKGHLPGAINLPREQWRVETGLKKDKLNVIYCCALECQQAAQAAMEFAANGYSVMEMAGGFEAWQENGFQTDKQVHH